MKTKIFLLVIMLFLVLYQIMLGQIILIQLKMHGWKVN